jgi:hypothetical protein
MHRHLCSECGAVITVDQDATCPSKSDHAEGLCEACALALPSLEENV